MAVSDLNFFRTFKGKYYATAPDGVTQYPIMLSCTNDVVFMERMTSNSNKLLCTLPPECRPTQQTITIYCYAWGQSDAQYVDIRTNGEVICALANTTYLLDGHTFNISRNFYG